MSDERTLDLLEAKIAELRKLDEVDGMNLGGEIARLETRLEDLRRELYSNLSDWERVRIARHPKRPYALDYIDEILDGFYELHGDRIAGDDRALLAGLARLDGRRLVVLAQQKGRSTQENKERFFGMTRPQGYRKGLRAMALAERFGLPVVTLIDTPGAYPGIAAEERGQHQAIAEAMFEMSRLPTPIVCVVIGEGGSGGALGIGVGDRVAMLEHSYYSVISPEGCAGILWKSHEFKERAAEALKMTSKDLLKLKIVDEVVREPLGGAHRDHHAMAAMLKMYLRSQIRGLVGTPIDQLLEARYGRFRRMGVFLDRTEPADPQPADDAEEDPSPQPAEVPAEQPGA